MFTRSHLVALALSSSTFLACSTDIGSQTEFSTDSWNEPTQHGELSFEHENRAEFNASTRFHGWSFSLSAAADIVLTVEPHDPNLDTVAYLYRADDAGRKIGKYLYKNDDHDGTLGSQIAESLPAAAYFLQVKSAKQLMRGPFEVIAECYGVGCPAAATTDPTKFCDSAYEAIDKCMDDSLDATREQCAPSAHNSEAVLCCNLVSTEPFCEDVCIGDNAPLVRYWGTQTNAIAEVFTDNEYNGLMSITDHAFATCLDPSLDDLAAMILASSELDHEDDWYVTGWHNADSAEFIHRNITQNVIDTATQIVGEVPASRFGATIELPCPSCTNGYDLDALYFKKSGRILILESRWGYDV